jgi:hypothetical protein
MELQCLPKRREILNIRNCSSLKDKVVRLTPGAKTQGQVNNILNKCHSVSVHYIHL